MKQFTQDVKARLLEMLGQEREVFGQIHKITGKQTELISADDVVAFDESLDQRQKLIDKINGLHQETNVLMQSYVAYSKSAGGKKIAEIEDAHAQLKDMIAKCAELNGKNEAALKEKSKEYSQRIDKMSLNRKTIGSYIQSIENTPELFDKMM